MKHMPGPASRAASPPAGSDRSSGKPRPYALLLTENRGLLAKIGQPFIAAGCDLVMSKTSHEASSYLARLRPTYVAVELGQLRSEPHHFLRSLRERKAREFQLIVIIRHPLLRIVAEGAHADHILTSRDQSLFLPAQIRRVCLDES